MTAESRSAFLAVRNDVSLARASEALGIYQSRLRRPAAGGIETVQGVWIDEADVERLPCALVLSDTTGTRRLVRIVEASGINGLWTLCWLEAAAGIVSRVELVAALLATFGAKDAVTFAARFAPVFAIDAPAASVSGELQRLDACYPGLVRPPIYQDATGRLLLPSAPAHGQGSAS